MQLSKMTGSHTTVAHNAVKKLLDFINYIDNVTKISLGIIQNKPGKSSRGQMRFKLTINRSCIELRFSHGARIQEMRIYFSDSTAQMVAEQIVRFILENRWNVAFGKHRVQ